MEFCKKVYYLDVRRGLECATETISTKSYRKFAAEVILINENFESIKYCRY